MDLYNFKHGIAVVVDRPKVRPRPSSGVTARPVSRTETRTSRSRTASRPASRRRCPTTRWTLPGTFGPGKQQGLVPHPPRQVQDRRLVLQAVAAVRDPAQLGRRDGRAGEPLSRGREHQLGHLEGQEEVHGALRSVQGALWTSAADLVGVAAVRRSHRGSGDALAVTLVSLRGGRRHKLECGSAPSGTAQPDANDTPVSIQRDQWQPTVRRRRSRGQRRLFPKAIRIHRPPIRFAANSRPTTTVSTTYNDSTTGPGRRLPASSSRVLGGRGVYSRDRTETDPPHAEDYYGRRGSPQQGPHWEVGALGSSPRISSLETTEGNRRGSKFPRHNSRCRPITESRTRQTVRRTGSRRQPSILSVSLGVRQRELGGRSESRLAAEQTPLCGKRAPLCSVTRNYKTVKAVSSAGSWTT